MGSKPPFDLRTREGRAWKEKQQKGMEWADKARGLQQEIDRISGRDKPAPETPAFVIDYRIFECACTHWEREGRGTRFRVSESSDRAYVNQTVTLCSVCAAVVMQ